MKTLKITLAITLSTFPGFGQSLLVPGHVGIGGALVDINPSNGLFQNIGLNLLTQVTDPTQDNLGGSLLVQLNSAMSPATNVAATGLFSGAETNYGDATNYNGVGLAGAYNGAFHGGTGKVGYIRAAYLDGINYNGGTVGYMQGGYSHAYNTGTVTRDVSTFWAASFDNYGTAPAFYAYYSEAQAGATNNYFLYYNGTNPGAGVFRVNGLGILAYYNPNFPTYTPAKPDFERIVLQWNGNVAEIGNEKGGTGTLRPTRILGASVDAAAYQVGGTPGISYSGNVKGLTIVNGIVTAAW